MKTFNIFNTNEAIVLGSEREYVVEANLTIPEQNNGKVVVKTNEVMGSSNNITNELGYFSNVIARILNDEEGRYADKNITVVVNSQVAYRYFEAWSLMNRGVKTSEELFDAMMKDWMRSDDETNWSNALEAFCNVFVVLYNSKVNIHVMRSRNINYWMLAGNTENLQNNMTLSFDEGCANNNIVCVDDKRLRGDHVVRLFNGKAYVERKDAFVVRSYLRELHKINNNKLAATRPVSNNGEFKLNNVEFVVA